jgi:hypothetical protein
MAHTTIVASTCRSWPCDEDGEKLQIVGDVINTSRRNRPNSAVGGFSPIATGLWPVNVSAAIHPNEDRPQGGGYELRTDQF